MIYKYSKNEQGGFTLIELMVVVAILSIIILGLITFFSGGTRSWIAGQSQLKAQREARQKMDMMVREIREGKEIVDGSGNYLIIKVPVFNSEGLPSSDKQVKYELVGTTIHKNDSSPLIDNVLIESGDKIFKYYNSSGEELSSPDSTVSKLHINLKIDVDNDNKPDINLNSDVELRNHGLYSL